LSDERRDGLICGGIGSPRRSAFTNRDRCRKDGSSHNGDRANIPDPLGRRHHTSATVIPLRTTISPTATPMTSSGRPFTPDPPSTAISTIAMNALTSSRPAMTRSRERRSRRWATCCVATSGSRSPP
jgi:hypothetical protein